MGIASIVRMDMVAPSLLTNARMVGHRNAPKAIQDAMKSLLHNSDGSDVIELIVPASTVQNQQLLPYLPAAEPYLLTPTKSRTSSENVDNSSANGVVFRSEASLQTMRSVFAIGENIKSISNRENERYMMQLPSAEAPKLPGTGGSIAERAFLSNNHPDTHSDSIMHGDDDFCDPPSTELTKLEQELFNSCTKGDCETVLSILRDEYGVPAPPDRLSDSELHAQYVQYFIRVEHSKPLHVFPSFPGYSTGLFANENNSYLGNSSASSEHDLGNRKTTLHTIFGDPKVRIPLPLHSLHHPNNGSTPLHALCSSSAVVRAETYMRALWKTSRGSNEVTFDCNNDKRSSNEAERGSANTESTKLRPYFPFFPTEFDPSSPITLLHRTILSLLFAGIPVNALSGNGSTPLHWCAGSGSAIGCYTLLEYGANPLLRTYTWRRQVFGRNSGQTPFHWASESNHPTVLYTLSEYSPIGTALQDERSMIPLELAEKSISSDAELACKKLEAEQWIGLRIIKEVTTTGLVN